MSVRVIKGHIGIGDTVTGEALVAYDNFSARYDLDRINGTFSRESHVLFKQSYDGKVLVLNIAKGGVATAWMLREMKETGVTPLALLLNYANPIMAQGAAFADFPMIDRFEGDITKMVKTGDMVTVNPAEGTVSVRSG
jgi:predicted aconitase with swiveling domain